MPESTRNWTIFGHGRSDYSSYWQTRNIISINYHFGYIADCHLMALAISYLLVNFYKNKASLNLLQPIT